jgi:ankyrin repeat protein
LAWDADVNAKDSKGITPLHLAVKSSEDLQSTRSIRHLLIKGADRATKVKLDFNINQLLG